MRYTPEAVAQDTWPYLLCLSLCDLVQVPEAGLHLKHEVWKAAVSPPQRSPSSWVCSFAASGNWGSEQLAFVTGLKISADLIPPSFFPPVIKTTKITL